MWEEVDHFMAVVDDLSHSGMDTSAPSEDFGRQPPQDAAAEQSVLGGMLLSKDAIADVLERLRPGMEGVGKVEIDRRPLVWIWTRQVIDWIRLQLWTWLP